MGDVKRTSFCQRSGLSSALPDLAALEIPGAQCRHQAQA